MKKPNLLFIMTDQQRFDALGANGNDIIQTPNLDALADAGANLQEYFTNCPVCVPSRCTLLTGRYPHSHGVKENYNKYPLDKIELYPEREGEIAEKARRWAIKQGAMNATVATAEERKRYVAIYYAMISWIDTQVGTLLELLRAKGLDQDTIVVFTADHGEFAFEHGMAKKDLVLVDSLLHVPCLIAWPGHIPAHKHHGTFMEEVDILPTLLELMNVETPFCVQGESFAPVLKGETDAHKDAVFSEINPSYLFNKYQDMESFYADHGGRDKAPFNVPGDFTKSIRDRHWRYVWYHDGSEELYDHRSDPLEQYNVADMSENADVKNRLKMRLLEWNALSEDPLDTNGRRVLQKHYPDWTPNAVQPGPVHAPKWVETRQMRTNRFQR